MVSLNTATLLKISFIKGVGTKKMLSLRGISDIGKYPISEILRKHLSMKNVSEVDVKKAEEHANIQIEQAKSYNHTIISFFDSLYPKRLEVMSDAPPILFCAGNINLLSSKNVTVIGTREPTIHGEIICKKITTWLVKNRFNIVSGLALGVDAIAHKTCLENSGGTIAALAHGLEKIYPKTNQTLGDQIIKKNGLLVTEYKYNSFLSKGNFVQRDKIQAALGDAVFLIQSGENGGSLHASRAILEYNKPLIVVGQSKTDLENGSEKCMANLNLLSGDKETIRRTLKVDSPNYNLIVPLANKKEYGTILTLIENVSSCQIEAPTHFDF